MMRRRLAAVIALAALAALAAAAALPAEAEPSPALLAAAEAALAAHDAPVEDATVMVIADFGRHSSAARLHVVTRRTGAVTSYRAAHGRGSDPDHDGMLDRFSNLAGSQASPDGMFVTAERYHGRHGDSLRLDGLEPGNSNARARAIVIHAAWYAEPEFLARHGRLGRSNGCIVLSQADRDALFAALENGTPVWVTR